MPMISIIVPVYKMEKYIGRCIESILFQTYDNFELILVDDGSPDRSGELCDNFEKKDKRIRVIHKENGGVSTARNAGLAVAKGEYVCFCDADDTLPEDALEKMICSMQTSDIQLAVGDLMRIYTDEEKNTIGTTKSYIRPSTCIHLCDADKIYEFWKNNNMLSSCGKLFLRDIIVKHELRFRTDMIVMEDYAFVIDYVSKCKSICMIPDSVYSCHSVAGITAESKRARKDFFDDVLLASKKLSDFAASFSAKWTEKYQEDTIYPTLRFAYELLWTIEASGYRCRMQKYKRIASAMQNETAQKMFLFYKEQFSRMEYFFIKKKCMLGILAVHCMRRVLKRI